MTPSPTAPHSPTPWKLHDRYTDEVWSDGVCVCTTSEQNAALIVRAVNSHEGLVKCRDALNTILEAMALEEFDQSSQRMLRRFDLLRDKARAALAEAGEACR